MALGLSLCAVTTLQLLYGTLHIMVPTQLMCTHNHTTVGQYTTPTDDISQPNPRGTRAPAPLLPRGGEGGRAVLEPLFSQEGFCFWDIGNRLRDVVICPVRACVRAHTFLPHHHPPPPPPVPRRAGERSEEEEEEAGHQQPTRRRRRRRRTTTPPPTTTTSRWHPLLDLSFFLLAFEATSFAAFVTKNTKPDSVACCFKM